ncbi:TadE-like protein [Micromonospora rhizosphaerae]|uniref:TadE-like protein n=2 Tax=Micromonospora rhizosphaerae TaxID=568872 RepID=A0A1C6REF2_9ACTN|nr:TadE-like protein [Micromonospora rhizosphaerae]
MALVLPLLLVLIFGIIDFGRMLNKQIALTEAARDAARVASFGRNAEDSKAAATARATRIAGDDAVVNTAPCSTAGQDAQVIVTQDFSFITPVGLIGGGFDGKVTLTGRGVVPCQ